MGNFCLFQQARCEVIVKYTNWNLLEHEWIRTGIRTLGVQIDEKNQNIEARQNITGSYIKKECRESRNAILISCLTLQLMMMMNCLCGMVDRWKAFSLIPSRDHCQRSSPSRFCDTPRAGFEPAQSLSSGLVEWSCAVVKPLLHGATPH